MPPELPPKTSAQPSPVLIGMWMVLGLVLMGFCSLIGRFGNVGAETAFGWLVSTWNPETNYEHGWLVVGLTGWLVWRAWPGFTQAALKPSILGLGITVIGVLLFLAGWRTLQPRVCVASVPIIILGALVFTNGWARTKHLIFPLSMFAFVIPMPGLQQATTGLQIIATKMAHQASELIGMDMGISGNRVYDPSGNWGSWEIDEGCSGIRSIVALTLVTYIYGMIVHKKWSERLVIFAACIPVAIVANVIRVTSILIVARFDVNFAKTTWHDYSGFMSFAVALAILMVLSTVIRFGLRALKPKVSVTRIGGGTGGQAAPAAMSIGQADPY